MQSLACLQEELWEQTVTGVERTSGRKVPEDLVLSALADRLISSGTPCLPALRAALSAVGHSVSLQELRQMPSTELKHCIAQVGQKLVDLVSLIMVISAETYQLLYTFLYAV